MRTRSIALAILLVPTVSWSRGGQGLDGEIDRAGTQIEGASKVIESPASSDAERQAAEATRTEARGALVKIGDAHPTNPKAQLKIGQTFAKTGDANAGIPFAERGLALAEASGDPKLLRSALLTGSWVYAKAGQFELASERAQRVLKQNPRDKEALALYMEVKGRTSAASPAVTGGAQGGGGGAGAAGQAAAQAGLAGPGVAMTSAASREAQRHLVAGRGMMKLDPKAALRLLDQAVAADAQNAEARLERAKARLVTGDAAGSIQDADAALTLNSRLGEAYAVRGEAKRALGRAEAELLADYETAAKLDGRFTEAYKGMTAKLASASSASAPEGGSRPDMAGRSAPDGFWGILTHPPKKWGLFALIAVIVAAVGGLLAPLVLKKKFREITSTSTPTPRP